jgi:hypothetical protein
VFRELFRTILMLVLVMAAPGVLLATSGVMGFGQLNQIPESAALVLSGLGLMLIARFARRLGGRARGPSTVR